MKARWNMRHALAGLGLALALCSLSACAPLNTPSAPLETGSHTGETSGMAPKRAPVSVPEKPNGSAHAPTVSKRSATADVMRVPFGGTAAELASALGAPQRRDPSHIGVEWWVYDKDLNNYFQVGIENGRVVTLFIDSMRFGKNGVRIGTTKAELVRRLGAPQASLEVSAGLWITGNQDKQPSYLIDGLVYTFYIDRLGGDRVAGVRVSTRKHFASIALGLGYGIRYIGTPPSLPPSTSAQLQAAAAAYEREGFELANIARMRAGLPKLVWNPRAARSARAHSADMADHGFFSHTSPTTGSPFDRLTHAGVPFVAAAENIAAGQLDAIQAHFDWMNSPGHRSNLLHPYLKELGVGVVILPEQAGRMSTYFTQEFVTRP